MNIPELDSLFSIRHIVSLLIIGVCVCTDGCTSSSIWSGEARSPNGKMIATASTFQDRGFLAGSTQTTVFLNWAVGSQSKTLILAYSDGATASDMTVDMKWLTPTHLQLTYSGQRSLDFQAVKCAGIEISVRNLATGLGETGPSSWDGRTRSLPAPPASAYQKAAEL